MGPTQQRVLALLAEREEPTGVVEIAALLGLSQHAVTGALATIQPHNGRGMVYVERTDRFAPQDQAYYKITEGGRAALARGG